MPNYLPDEIPASKKPKGRTPLYTERLVRKNFRLRPEDFTYLQSLTGNASLTIRQWIDEHKKEDKQNEF